jgi:hypothetical protein
VRNGHFIYFLSGSFRFVGSCDPGGRPGSMLGGRRTSSSCRPSASSWRITPYRALWSGSEPISSVSGHCWLASDQGRRRAGEGASHRSGESEGLVEHAYAIDGTPVGDWSRGDAPPAAGLTAVVVEVVATEAASTSGGFLLCELTVASAPAQERLCRSSSVSRGGGERKQPRGGGDPSGCRRARRGERRHSLERGLAGRVPGADRAGPRDGCRTRSRVRL